MEWRSSFGSTALEVVDLFFAEQGLKGDKFFLRKEAAVVALMGLRFLYKSAKGNDKNVCLFLFDILECISLTAEQKYKGLFRSEIFLRTLAHHVSAIEGHVRVPGLVSEEALQPRTALALAATAVSFPCGSCDILT